MRPYGAYKTSTKVPGHQRCGICHPADDRKTMTHREIVGRLVKAMNSFRKTQNKFARFGAADTEPSWHFENSIRNVVLGRDPQIPTTGREWELYVSSMRCETAATALTKALKRVVKVLEGVTMANEAEVLQFLKDHCWRVDFN